MSSTPDQYNYLMAIGKKSGTVTLYRVLNEPRNIMMNRLRKKKKSIHTHWPEFTKMVYLKSVVSIIP